MTKNIDYIDKHDTQGIKFGLDNIFELLKSFDNPHKELKVIHIAGTNGKGSVGAYLLYILARAGYKVGRLSSPAVFEENEFAQIMQYKDDYVIENIPLEYLQEKTGYLKQTKLRGIPSGFEVQVAISMLFFKENNCDIVIVETGMGGTLDATNIFETTLCDVITPISMDHMNMLGNTLLEIAMNKYGIITSHGNVVTTEDNYNISDKDGSLVEKICTEKMSNLFITSQKKEGFVDKCCFNIDNNVFEYKNEGYRIRQNGQYQIENAILAINVANVLQGLGYNIEIEALKLGLYDMKIKGRFDVINKSPLIVADGAHNVAGVRALLDSIEVYFKDKNVIFVTSVFKDKDYNRMFEMMASRTKMVIYFDTANPRSLKCKNIDNTKIYKTKNLEEALDIAKNNCKDDDIIVCAGSLSFMKLLYSINI